ncbi:stage II sporulation protein M [Ancylomarina sp. YFZ004]
MKEVVFLDINANRWKTFEDMLNNPKKMESDNIADLYIQLTDDLSYAQTYYPESETTIYLNQLSARVHQHIYKNKKMKTGRLKTFWTRELPLIMYGARKQLLYAFLIFVVSMLIGIISAKNDLNFVRIIMGDNYVNMTIENIKKGDPLAVYKQSGETMMFLQITINNVKVAFIAFLFGIFTAFGTGFMLFKNGVMLGSFQYFFVQHDLFWESTRVIWIHGALEISAIILAGCAGMVMGNSLIFTKTLPRKTSLNIGVKKGLKIVVGTVPLFIVAGFLEGFVTRHTEMPITISWIIILLSFTFIVWYFIIYPYQLIKADKKLLNTGN